MPPPSGRTVYERLAERRRDLYSERLSDADRDLLHVPTELDAFVIDRIQAGVSVVLTGNAGDGKTHLFKQLRDGLPSDLEVVEDATAEMTDGRAEPVLDRLRRALAGGRKFVLCANEHQLLKLREVARVANGRLATVFGEIDRQCRHRLVHGEVNAQEEAARENVLVVDLSLRNPLAPGFARRVLEKLLADPGVRARAAADPGAGRNHKRLSHPQVQSRLLAIFERLTIRGERATVRQLWMTLARALFAPDANCPGDAPRAWYSEQLFGDGSLEIDRLLRRHADPAAQSHPRWDWHLSEAHETDFRPEDWPVDGVPIGVNRNTDLRHWFDGLKRRFYFEHIDGDEIFALETAAGREFQSLLREGPTPDPAQVSLLLRGLNRLYCAPGFPEDDVSLHLWQGLRYHEQPSRAYMSAVPIHRNMFRLERPRPPARVAEAFCLGAEPLYIPNHLLLVASLGGSTTRLLKIDYALFSILLKVAEGLPRHLVPEQHIHRVDAFLERIGASTNVASNDFLLFNAEDGVVAKIATSSTQNRLESVRVIS